MLVGSTTIETTMSPTCACDHRVRQGRRSPFDRQAIASTRGVDRGPGQSRRRTPRPPAGQVPEFPGGHLRAPRCLDAQEQHRGLVAHDPQAAERSDPRPSRLRSSCVRHAAPVAPGVALAGSHGQGGYRIPSKSSGGSTRRGHLPAGDEQCRSVERHHVPSSGRPASHDVEPVGHRPQHPPAQLVVVPLGVLALDAGRERPDRPRASRCSHGAKLAGSTVVARPSPVRMLLWVVRGRCRLCVWRPRSASSWSTAASPASHGFTYPRDEHGAVGPRPCGVAQTGVRDRGP